jgi:hypothetical protein
MFASETEIVSLGLISIFAAGFFPTKISCTLSSAVLNCPVGSIFAPARGISPFSRRRVTVRLDPALAELSQLRG